MSWKAILKRKLDSYVVKDSIWKEAFGLLGANDRRISTGQFMATFEEIEKALNRKLTPHDFAFLALNYHGDVERHLGPANYKLMLELFTDKDYQIKSLEGDWEAVNVTREYAQEGLQEELERLS
tara:strand:+ start:1174 stop:1545 length:372 start_codon:yes stop_codon:yes gene_type:complete